MNYRVALMMIHDKKFFSAFEEIGISLIASYLREKSIDVLLINEIEHELDIDAIQSYQPDMIGFTVYQANLQAVIRMAHRFKNQIAGIKICAGGIYPTYAAERMLEQCDAIDFCISGEGEYAMEELICKLTIQQDDLSGIKGLTYRSDGRIVKNQARPQINNLDKMPFMARDFLAKQQIKIANISGSRGCCAKCSFCAKQLFFSKWVGRSIDNILDEIVFVQETQQVHNFMFMDSSFEDPYSDLRRMQALAQGILKRNIHINYYFNIRSDFYKKATPPLMDLLKRSGLSAFGLGIESSNDSDLKLFNKGITPEDNYRILEFIRMHDLQVFVGFINFTPYSSIQSLYDNLEFLEIFRLPFLFFTSLEVYELTDLNTAIAGDESLSMHINDHGKCTYQFANADIRRYAEQLKESLADLDRRYPGLFSSLNQKNRIIPLQLFYYRTIVTRQHDKTINYLYSRNKKLYEGSNQKLCNLLFRWIRQNLQTTKDNRHSFLAFNEYELQQLLLIQKQYQSIYDDLRRISLLTEDRHE